MAFELLLMRFMPGKEFRATKTPMGNVPVYNANGVQCYLSSIAFLALGTYMGWFRPGDVYDLMGNLLSSMNVFALLFCLFLTIKGYYFPSSTDCGANGSLVLDYYWGTELYPRIFGLDVKVFTNCRFGMMFWALGIISYAHK
jgi:7-dehydrocholesterol reductase